MKRKLFVKLSVLLRLREREREKEGGRFLTGIFFSLANRIVIRDTILGVACQGAIYKPELVAPPFPWLTLIGGEIFKFRQF